MNPDEVDVWIVDSSALIKAKAIVAVNNQWAAFKHLEQMVIGGRIALPRQVINEMSEIAHPDLAWSLGAGRSREPSTPLGCGL